MFHGRLPDRSRQARSPRRSRPPRLRSDWSLVYLEEQLLAGVKLDRADAVARGLAIDEHGPIMRALGLHSEDRGHEDARDARVILTGPVPLGRRVKRSGRTRAGTLAFRRPAFGD